VFTEPLLRNGLHNPVVPPLIGAADIENTASSIVACWTVFTELLPGNELIKSVTILSWHQDFQQPTIEFQLMNKKALFIVALKSY
jgi:hypothetical protein